MKKNGFTLIELSTTMVVLGVIMLIAFPTFIKLIVDARTGAFKVSVERMIDAIDIKTTNREINLNPAVITENNLSEMLGVSNDNFANVEVTKNSEDKLFIVVEGKNKFTGFTACGYAGSIEVKPLEDCGIPGIVLTKEEITALVSVGYIPIATAEELDSIRTSGTRIYGAGTKWAGTYTSALNSNFIQVTNIDLGKAPYNTGEGWLPIGTRLYNCETSDVIPQTGGEIFTGVYNGGGYTISNLYMRPTTRLTPIGLFSTSSGSFYNMVFENADIVAGADTLNVPMAILVGQITGGADVVINNVKLSGNVQSLSPTEGKVGSIVGQVGLINSIAITESHFKGNVISGYHQAGGFIGQIRAYNEILIQNSTVKGSVVSTYNRTGGFIGEASYQDPKDIKKLDNDVNYEITPRADSVTIRDSYFKGDVISEYNRTAGLIGELRYLDNLTIDGSYAEANIVSDYSETGGLIGTSLYVRNLNLLNAHHEGTIVSNYNKTAGIIGTVELFDNLIVENVHHEGNITSGYGKTGGLFGQVTWYGWNFDSEQTVFNTADSFSIKNSYVKGNIKGTYGKVAGVVGEISSIEEVTIDNVDFNGDVQGGYGKDGGLAGYIVDVRTLIVKNVDIDGDIIGCYGDVGGLVGTVEYVTSTIFDNNNYTGEIKFTDVQDSDYEIEHYLKHVGGLVGRIGSDSGWRSKVVEPFLGNVSIKNSTAKGTLNGIGTRIGGLIGSSDTTTSVLDQYTINIEKSSFDGVININNHAYTVDTSPDNGWDSTGEDNYYVLAGGLVGAGFKINIVDSYAIGTIRAVIDTVPVCTGVLTNHMIGGLVGRIVDTSSINNSYSAMNLNITENGSPLSSGLATYVKAMAGTYDKTTINNSYYDSSITSYTDDLAIAKTTGELKMGIIGAGIFETWTTETWNFDSNVEYPSLNN